MTLATIIMKGALKTAPLGRPLCVRASAAARSRPRRRPPCLFRRSVRSSDLPLRASAAAATTQMRTAPTPGVVAGADATRWACHVLRARAHARSFVRVSRMRDCARWRPSLDRPSVVQLIPGIKKPLH
jgi:hypothetical protein